MTPYVIEVKQVPAQPILSARATSSVETLAETIGTLISEVAAVAHRSGVAFAGMPFTRYHRIEPDIEVEAGLPVVQPVAGEGRVIAGELPAGEVASTIHVGPLSQLPLAGDALREWAKSAGREPSGLIREIYLNDPGVEPDASKWQTELVLPLKP